MNIATILLAAGASTRMGTPKQLLPIGNTTLLRKLIDEVIETQTYPITVVLGANRDKIAPEIADIPINFVVNHQWETGMASSIKMGLVGTYMIEKNIEAVIIMTADMPYVTHELLEKFIHKATTTQAPIIASRYDNTVGVPALFKREVFTELLELTGEEGAKSLLKKYKNELEVIDFQQGSVDLDTQVDYFTFLQSNN